MRVDYLRIGDKDQMVRRGVHRPMLPLRPVTCLDMLAESHALAIVDGVEPDAYEHESCQGESLEDGVLAGQGAQLVGGGMVQMHYVLWKPCMRTLISPAAGSSEGMLCLRRVSSLKASWKLRLRLGAVTLVMQGSVSGEESGVKVQLT